MKAKLLVSIGLGLLFQAGFKSYGQRQNVLPSQSSSSTNSTSQQAIQPPPDEKLPVTSTTGVGFVNFTKKIVAPVVAVATELYKPLQKKYASLMHRNESAVSNGSLYTFIDNWWGTRYLYGGTTKRGVDCSSLSGQLLLKVFGIALPRTAREQYAACAKLTRAQLREGDLVFFNTTGGVSHVGVYLGEGYFVHSCSSKGVTINNLDESYYNKRFISGGRPPIAYN